MLSTRPASPARTPQDISDIRTRQQSSEARLYGPDSISPIIRLIANLLFMTPLRTSSPQWGLLGLSWESPVKGTLIYTSRVHLLRLNFSSWLHPSCHELEPPRAIRRGRGGHVKMKVSHSGSKPLYKGDTKKHALQDPCV